MYTVTVTVAARGELGGSVHVHLGGGGGHAAGIVHLPAATTEGTATADEGPSPIAPEPKELLWGLGAFVVLLVAMRLFLFPKVRRGMTARYGLIRAGHERADALREEAQREVADYEHALSSVRAEAAGRIEAASRQLESERTERLDTVNATIAERKAAATAEYEAAKEAARDTIEAAVVDVAARTVELSTGRRPDDEVVRRAAADVIGVGVGS